MVRLEDIEVALREKMPVSHLVLNGDGRHFELLMVSEAFAGLRRVRRHQEDQSRRGGDGARDDEQVPVARVGEVRQRGGRLEVVLTEPLGVVVDAHRTDVDGEQVPGRVEPEVAWDAAEVPQRGGVDRAAGHVDPPDLRSGS